MAIPAASPISPVAAPAGSARVLPPLADTIAQRLVFAPLVQDWFTAAARTGVLYVDHGRVDIDLAKDPARLPAFERAAEARSPFPVGTRFRIRGAWGSEEATLRRFAACNGRIVAVLDGAPMGDSLARLVDPLVASAQRLAAGGGGAGAAPPAAVECDRTPAAALLDRLTHLARQVEDSLRAGTDQPLYPRLEASLTARRATVRDLRFRAHEALHALDADGDGVDDLAARAWTPRGGGTVILKLSAGPRLERLASGFAWER